MGGYFGGGGGGGAINTHGVLDKMRRSHSFHMCVCTEIQMLTQLLCVQCVMILLDLMCQVT